MQTGQQKIQQLFTGLKCPTHNNNEIMQLCISTQCQSDSRLCCMQCVDDKHMGGEHMLISSTKFSKLMCEFHLIQKQKQPITQQLLKWLLQQQKQVNITVDKYYRFIQQSLVRENELTSYEEITQISKSKENQQEKSRKLNQIVDLHVWMLEANCVAMKHHKVIDLKEEQGRLVRNLKVKYDRLQRRLREVNQTCEQQIKQVIKKRSLQVKKLFHLFDQIKYNLQDDGNQLQSLTSSMSKLIIENDLAKENEQLQEQQEQVKQVFDFMGNVAGGR